jgi:hypothetical protein
VLNHTALELQRNHRSEDSIAAGSFNILDVPVSIREYNNEKSEGCSVNLNRSASDKRTDPDRVVVAPFDGSRTGAVPLRLSGYGPLKSGTVPLAMTNR